MKAERAAKPTGTYHHGDLRNAMIIATAQLIEETGSTDFAMVDAARKAGVSSAAPYRHFKDKDDLLTAVTELCFWALTEAAYQALEGQQRGTKQAIIAVGRCYIEFVTSHPKFYQLMFGDQGLRVIHNNPDELKATGFFLLVDLVGAWCQQQQLPHHDEQKLAVKLWAMAHGLSGLALYGHIDAFIGKVDIYALLESSATTFLEGLKSENS